MGDVGSVKGYPVGPTTFVRDVYALVGKLTPGRLLHSLKSGLATSYDGTTIFGRFYKLMVLAPLHPAVSSLILAPLADAPEHTE